MITQRVNRKIPSFQVGIDEFDLDQESDGKLKITVHCKY